MLDDVEVEVGGVGIDDVGVEVFLVGYVGVFVEYWGSKLVVLVVGYLYESCMIGVKLGFLLMYVGCWLKWWFGKELIIDKVLIICVKKDLDYSRERFGDWLDDVFLY